MAPRGHDEPTSERATPGVPVADSAAGHAAARPRVVELPDDFFVPAETRAIATRDIRLLVMLPFLALVAWTLPDRQCFALCRAAARLLHWLRPARYSEFEGIFSRYLPDDASPETSAAMAMEAAALHHLEHLQLLRYHRPGSWRPRIDVVGKEHVERALAGGKGAILWITLATFSDMITKVALRELGYDVWHLSRHTHGHLSGTRFGIGYLNPIRISLECRYLADRVVIDPAHPRAALARLEQLLADNQVVSITVRAEARRVTLAPFGPGVLPLAGGAPSLALKSGAALLPVFAERRPDGSFLVTIEPPLEAPEGHGRDQKVTDLIAAEGALLWRYFERQPLQYQHHSLQVALRRLQADGVGVGGSDDG